MICHALSTALVHSTFFSCLTIAIKSCPKNFAVDSPHPSRTSIPLNVSATGALDTGQSGTVGLGWQPLAGAGVGQFG